MNNKLENMKNVVLVILATIFVVTACNGNKLDTSLPVETSDTEVRSLDQILEQDGVREEMIAYDTAPDGLGQWMMTTAAKNMIIEKQSCEGLEGQYLPVLLGQANHCGVTNNDWQTIVYIIGQGFVYERTPYITSAIIVLQEEKAIFVSNLLPNLNQELDKAAKRIVEEQPEENFDFASPAWIEINDQLNQLANEYINSEFMLNEFQKLKKIAESL